MLTVEPSLTGLASAKSIRTVLEMACEVIDWNYRGGVKLLAALHQYKQAISTMIVNTHLLYWVCFVLLGNSTSLLSSEAQSYLHPEIQNNMALKHELKNAS